MRKKRKYIIVNSVTTANDVNTVNNENYYIANNNKNNILMHLSLLMDCLLPVESTVQIGLENIWHEDIHKYQGKGKVI